MTRNEKNERQKMYNLLYQIIVDFSNMKSFWNGDTGVQTSEYLNDYINDLDSYIQLTSLNNRAGLIGSILISNQ